MKNEKYNYINYAINIYDKNVNLQMFNFIYVLHKAYKDKPII